MPQIMCNIRLDVSVNECGQSIMAKRGDVGSRCICVRFTDCGRDLMIEKDATVTLNTVRNGEKRCFEGVVKDDGCAVFTLPLFALEEVGEVLCDVSAYSTTGERLSTTTFTIVVEDGIALDLPVVDREGGDLIAEWIATETVYPMTPEESADGLVLSPAINRKYSLDLTDSRYMAVGALQNIAVHLPTPTQATRDAWVLITCHTLPYGATGPITFDWGENVIFHHGVAPDIVFSDFDIVCTYSHMASCWQIGVLQYNSAREDL